MKLLPITPHYQTLANTPAQKSPQFRGRTDQAGPSTHQSGESSSHSRAVESHSFNASPTKPVISLALGRRSLSAEAADPALRTVVIVQPDHNTQAMETTVSVLPNRHADFSEIDLSENLSGNTETVASLPPNHTADRIMQTLLIAFTAVLSGSGALLLQQAYQDQNTPTNATKLKMGFGTTLATMGAVLGLMQSYWIAKHFLAQRNRRVAAQQAQAPEMPQAPVQQALQDTVQEMA